MDMRINRFKQRLLAGEVQYGLWLGLSDTFSAEICAGGVLVGDKAYADRYRQAGARFIAVGVDTLLLSAATSALCAEYIPELSRASIAPGY